jgi:hypothetical protein
MQNSFLLPASEDPVLCSLPQQEKARSRRRMSSGKKGALSEVSRNLQGYLKLHSIKREPSLSISTGPDLRDANNQIFKSVRQKMPVDVSLTSTIARNANTPPNLEQRFPVSANTVLRQKELEKEYDKDNSCMYNRMGGVKSCCYNTNFMPAENDTSFDMEYAQSHHPCPQLSSVADPGISRECDSLDVDCLGDSIFIFDLDME